MNFLAAFCWSLALTSVAVRHTPVELPRQESVAELNADWIAMDVARIEELRAALGVEALTVEGLQKQLGSSSVREDRLIGFGARRLLIAAYGGYTTALVHVLAQAPDQHGKSRIAELRCDQTGSAATWAALAPRLREPWGAGAQSIERGFRAQFVNAELARSLRADCERALGAAGKFELPAALQPAFETLTSPFTDLILGRFYSIDGGPPPGRLELQALVQAGRLDLVRAVLRGMNPEGRAWAAWALLEHAKLGTPALDPEDATAIAALRKLPLKLNTCQGCSLEALQFDAALLAIDR